MLYLIYYPVACVETDPSYSCYPLVEPSKRSLRNFEQLSEDPGHKKTPSANRRGITMSKAGNPAKYLTIFIKSCDQIVRDQLSRPAFNLVTLDHMHQLPVLK